MNLDFYKLYTGRNDFILFDLQKEKDFPAEELPGLSRQACRRREGIGANGAVFLFPGTEGPVRFRFFRPDGQESLLFYDALLCFSRYAFDSGIAKKNVIQAETLDGSVTVDVLDSDNFRLTLGIPKDPPGRPLSPDPDGDFFATIEIEGRYFAHIPLVLGKPGAVFIDGGEYRGKHRQISRRLERLPGPGGSPLFPVFVTINTRDDISVDSPLGSLNADNASNCALGAAGAYLAGLADNEILVRSRRSRYFFQWNAGEKEVRITGSADYSFSGSFYYEERFPREEDLLREEDHRREEGPAGEDRSRDRDQDRDWNKNAPEAPEE